MKYMFVFFLVFFTLSTNVVFARKMIQHHESIMFSGIYNVHGCILNQEGQFLSSVSGQISFEKEDEVTTIYEMLDYGNQSHPKKYIITYINDQDFIVEGSGFEEEAMGKKEDNMMSFSYSPKITKSHQAEQKMYHLDNRTMMIKINFFTENQPSGEMILTCMK